MSKKYSNQSEQVASTFNSIPIIVLLLLNLLGVGAILGLLLSQKDAPATTVSNPPSVSKNVRVDRLGNITLDKDRVKFDLIALDGGSVNVQQEVSLPQEGFVHGYQLLEQFMAQLIEKGYVEKGGE